MPIRSCAWTVLALVASALAACAWSVPAHPGKNASLRRPSADTRTVLDLAAEPAADDAATRALYESHCGRCHPPFPPSHLSAERWPFFVAKYGPRAGLFGAEREQVLAWLQSQSR